MLEIARNFDEDEAEKMLRNSLEWRKKNQIDDILDNWQVPEVLEKYYSMGVCGNDKYGCPCKPFYSVIIAMIF